MLDISSFPRFLEEGCIYAVCGSVIGSDEGNNVRGRRNVYAAQSSSDDDRFSPLSWRVVVGCMNCGSTQVGTVLSIVRGKLLRGPASSLQNLE